MRYRLGACGDADGVDARGESRHVEPQVSGDVVVPGDDATERIENGGLDPGASGCGDPEARRGVRRVGDGKAK